MSLLMQKQVAVPGQKYTAPYLEGLSDRLKENTIKNRTVQLKFFSKFCFEKLSNWDPKHMCLVDLDAIIREILYDIPKDERIEKTLAILQEYVWWRDATGLSPASNKLSLNHITEFLFWNGIRLDPRDIKQLKFPKIIKKPKYSLVMSELVTIVSVARKDRKALYLALISTAMRISEAMAVVKSDMKEVDGYFIITLRAETTKMSVERRVVLSKEAAAMIKPIYDKAGPDDRIFMSNRKQDYKREDNSFLRLIRKHGIGTEEKHPTLHRFRAFFYKTASKAVDTDFAHQMLGHSGQLMTYAELTDEELIFFYKKTEPEVTVMDYYKKKVHDKVMEEKVADLESRLDAAGLSSKVAC